MSSMWNIWPDGWSKSKKLHKYAPLVQLSGKVKLIFPKITEGTKSKFLLLIILGLLINNINSCSSSSSMIAHFETNFH